MKSKASWLGPYFAEWLGTFCLVFIGTAVATLQGFAPGYGTVAWLGTSLAFGAILFALIPALAPASGCHINPAVSLAMAVAGKLRWGRLPGYVLAQYLGAMAASSLLLFLLSGMSTYSLGNQGLAANGNPHGLPLYTLFVWESLLTALFLMVIFLSGRQGEGSLAHAAVVSSFLVVAHLVGLPLGGASLNPARSFAPAILQGGSALGLLWIFTLGPFLGGVAGFGIYKLLGKD